MLNYTTLFASAVVSLLVSIIVKEVDRYKAANAQRKSLSKALHTELKTLLNVYKPMMLRPEPRIKGGDIGVVSLSSNYTTIYEHNADKIGLLDADTVLVIVKAYTSIAALMDTLLVLSDCWNSYIRYQRTSVTELNYNKELAEVYLSDVISNHTLAYQMQQETISAIDQAISRLSEIT